MTARQDMEMEMKYGLSCACAVINDHPVSLRVQALVPRDFFSGQKEMADKVFVGFGHAVDIGNMFFGNDERVDRRLRVHVLEGGHEIVFVNDFGRDFFSDDSAENAARIRAHFLTSPVFEKLLKKQLRSPVWHAGPVCSTLMSSVSWSQS